MDNKVISIDSRIAEALRNVIRTTDEKIEKYICLDLNACQDLKCRDCPVGKFQKIILDFFYEKAGGEEDDKCLSS